MTDKIIDINEEKIKDYLGKFVKETVEETLNAMLDTEADEIIQAGKYERSSKRLDTRAGHYNRKLQTRAGEVNLKIPKLRKLPFESAIIQRYQRREISVEEAMVEMYLTGVSVRRIEDITEALWETKVSPGTISNMNKKVYDQIEKWRNLPLDKHYAYVYMDGIWLKRSWGGEVKNVSILVAIGVNDEGYREIIGVSEGMKEDKESWRGFLEYLKNRGLESINLIISDKSKGLIESIPEFYPEARWQRCIVHFYRNVSSKVPHHKIKEVNAMLKAIHSQENLTEAKQKMERVVDKLKNMKLSKAADIVENGCLETLTYYHYPVEHWKKIRTNNGSERVMKEIRRRTRVVGSFPDGQSALMLVAARLRHITTKNWSNRVYLNMKYLQDMLHDQKHVS